MSGIHCVTLGSRRAVALSPSSRHAVSSAPSERTQVDDFQKPAMNNRRYIISAIWELTSIHLWIAVISYYVFYNLPPEFSVQLAPIRSEATGPASILPRAFHVALHASNRRATERCYHHGEGVVTYGGFIVASGRAPDFCVPRKGRREVPFRLAWDWDDGVALPEHLRRRIAAAEKVGAVELEVQVRLFQGDGGAAGSGRPTWMWCMLRMDGADDVTSCTVFALQNWFAILV